MKVGLMNERPGPPPEGKLLAAALERSGLSIREASKRAGISYGRWRQIATGVQHVSPGNYAAVHAPARTVARMATVVGITPEQMETQGQRPDAAEIMRSGTPAWVRLGEALQARRLELDPRFYTRETFAAERGINIRLAQELELNSRENFTPLTLRDKVAGPYAVTFDSITATLRAAEDRLEAAPGTPEHLPLATPRRLEEVLRRDSAGSPQLEVASDPVPLSMEQVFDASLFTARIRERLADLAAHGDSRPDGDTVFDPQGDDPFDLGQFLGGGLSDAWNVALERGFTPDAAADLAGRTWAKAAPRWAGRDAGHRISR